MAEYLENFKGDSGEMSGYIIGGIEDVDAGRRGDGEGRLWLEW